MSNANWNPPPIGVRPPAPPMPTPHGDSIETCEADARPWTPTSSPAATPASTDPCSHLRGQILVLANLLNEALGVVKNVEAEGGDEAELLQHLVTQGDAAVMAVLQEHAAGGVRHG